MAAAIVTISAGLAGAEVPVLRAELTRIDLDPGMGFEDIDSGELTIDPNTRQVVLTLRTSGDEPSETVEIRLPLISTTRGTCSTTYTAQYDARPVDGPLEILRVIDNRPLRRGIAAARRCPNPGVPVSIDYVVTTSGFGSPVRTMHSNFSATALARSPDAPPPRD
jgi:hypothetical protein